MTIAIIGYGSLIWDLDDLEPRVAGAWQRGAGPRLPVEFSRISAKRKQGLVLAIDETAEALSPTSVIASVRDRLEDAIDDLARRERCQACHLGVATRSALPAGTSRFPSVLASVQAWLQCSSFEAAIWVELDCNFASITGTPFSLTTAATYLQNLKGEGLTEAWNYLERAPEETDTPLRRHMRAQAWWRALGSRDRKATEHAAEPA